MIRDQVVVTLRPRVMEALVLLADNAGAVVSKRELVDAVWSSGFVAENTVVHCIKELRNALGDSASSPQYLQTIPRRGYRMLVQVRPIETAPDTKAIERARYQLTGQRWVGFLIDGENLIGRGGEARIVAPSVRVSRHHARIVVSGTSVTIEDLESKNGTFVRNTRVAGPTPIEGGDRVRIGRVPPFLSADDGWPRRDGVDGNDLIRSSDRFLSGSDDRGDHLEFGFVCQ